MHSLSSVVFCLSIHNNPYICFSKNLLTFNALTLYYFYMKEISTILWMAVIWMMGLMPVRAAAGVPGSDLQGEKGETVICRGVEAHTSGPMLQIGQVAPDFHAVNAKMENLANNFGGFIVDQPKVPVRFRMLIAVDRIRKMFARLSLSLENGSDLLARITSVPVIENIFESHQLVFGF